MPYKQQYACSGFCTIPPTLAYACERPALTVRPISTDRLVVAFALHIWLLLPANKQIIAALPGSSQCAVVSLVTGSGEHCD